MNGSDNLSKMQKIYTAFRIIKICFAVLVPIATAGAAAVITICEGDWWFGLFAAYLAGILMATATLYLSLLTLMAEATRRIKSKLCKSNSATAAEKLVRRLLVIASATGVITFVPILLIFYDILDGGFALLHFTCGGIILILYITLGIYTAIRRK